MKKPIKLAAYSHMILLIITIIVADILGITTIQNPSFNIFNIVYSFVGILIGFVIYYGFILIGKKSKNKFLIISSLIGMVLLILSGFYLVFAQYSKSIDLSFSLFGGIFGIIWGFVVYKIKNIKYAKMAGSLDITAGFLEFIFITLGILGAIRGTLFFVLTDRIISIIAAIFEIMLLFQASKVFEKK